MASIINIELTEKKYASGGLESWGPSVIVNYNADGLLIGESIGGTRYYLLDDLLGIIRDVTTSTVSSVSSSNYKSYGSSCDLTLSLPDTFYHYYTHKLYLSYNRIILLRRGVL